MDSALGLTVLFGAGFAWILAVGLLFRGNKGPNHWVLFWMLLFLGIWQGQTGFSLLNVNREFLAPYSLLNLPAAYAFIPLFYAYGRKLSDPHFSVLRMIFLSGFLGVCIFVLEIYFLWFQPEIGPNHWKEMALSTWSDPNGSVQTSFPLSVLSFGPRILAILVSVILIFTAIRLKNAVNDRIRWNLVFLSLFGGIGATLSLYAQSQGKLKSNLHGLGAFFITLTICALYFFSQRFPIFFELDPNKQTNRKSRLTRLDSFDLRRRLEILLKEEKIYRVEDLSLNLLANALSQSGDKVTSEQVSEFINKNYEKNFNQFVNEYRVKEACEILLQDKKTSVLEIALFVGFNSKSTFHSAFKTFMGMSPVEYRGKQSGS